MGRLNYQIFRHVFTDVSNANMIDIDFSCDNGHFGSNTCPQPGNSAIERSIVPLSTVLCSFSIFVFAQPVRRREQTPIAGYAIGSW